MIKLPTDEMGFVSLMVAAGFVLFIILVYFISGILKKIEKIDEIKSLEQKIDSIKSTVDRIEPFMISHEQLKVRNEIEIGHIHTRLSKLENHIFREYDSKDL